MDIESTLKNAKEAFYKISALSGEQKNRALETFAQLIEANADFLLEENRKDLAQAETDNLAKAMLQRLKLDQGKIKQLAQGIRDLAGLPNPTGRVQETTKLDDGLILEKVSVPLGVIGIIFESRPDVIPQVLSLILKSGNTVVLKGGREARASNSAFMTLVAQLNAACDFLPAHWASLLESREAVHEMLHYPQYVDLIIPRGSNQLVQSIMAATRIPVLGHADGVCHLYVHESADLEKAIPLAIDAKAQYPAACNALETLLVDEKIAARFLSDFVKAAQAAGISLRGCEKTQFLSTGSFTDLNSSKLAPANLNSALEMEPATEEDWRTEYGDLTLSVKVVNSLAEAIAHVNRYGSHHTDAILAQDPAIIETFMNAVDSACVFANASTRFADGFRFGFGAEIGISTAKTHARGPVGLEGLVIYKYKLRGDGHRVADYTGENAKPFLHEKL